MKNILKMLLGLVLGSAIGLLIGGVFYVVFSGGTFSEYFGKLSSIDGLEMFELIGFLFSARFCPKKVIYLIIR